ncbi:hypothetical protein RHMOL_Rhmol07G0292800 [Rhododendron molle]|uniref:Uncharacterized protein n=2 Tax=Rhododendron molle TaxID=49168 RepID=A0ACC0N774_RHOML|nr:hypothetical protein RHMOL_Rhmol07G0292800 [Rhododendron molle]KAI8548682.1 hypothetical protein RHMOL_Rhmol07G0292800 [Rhododendron molle]
MLLWMFTLEYPSAIFFGYMYCPRPDGCNCNFTSARVAHSPPLSPTYHFITPLNFDILHGETITRTAFEREREGTMEAATTTTTKVATTAMMTITTTKRTAMRYSALLVALERSLNRVLLKRKAILLDPSNSSRTVSRLGQADFSSANTKVLGMVNSLAVDNEAKQTIDAFANFAFFCKVKVTKLSSMSIYVMGIVACRCYLFAGYAHCNLLRRILSAMGEVVMSFHECGGNVGDDVHIPLPQWVAEIGQRNPDMFSKNREGRPNPECLTWGVDEERVLRGRTALEVVHSSVSFGCREILQAP